jgi:phosphate transport system substrate-binding protein
MEPINQALKVKFESQFPGKTISLRSGEVATALQAVLEDKLDLAAIGRVLTDAEKAQGLVAVPIARHKIAVIVGADNPFTGSLTKEQFARIFRGEITDWSAVGGQAGAIRVVDRPKTSDLRAALSRYPAFQTAPFVTGANKAQVADDTTASVIQALGDDGIGYAIADQVLAQANVRLLSMYGTQPTDPRYPFSQSLAYVYKGPTPNVAIQSFLRFATASENQQTIASARIAAASISATTSSVDTATSAGQPPTSENPNSNGVGGIALTPELDRELPWWPWLLPAAFAGGGLFWWLRNRRSASISADNVNDTDLGNRSILSEGSANSALPSAMLTTGAAGVGAIATTVMPAMPAAELPTAASQNSRVVLTPRDPRHAYAYWDIAATQQAAMLKQGGQKLMLRLYDVTGINISYQKPHSVHQFECDSTAQDLHVSIGMGGRDYIADLGYVTTDGRWLQLARSAPIRTPAPTPTPEKLRVQPPTIAKGEDTALKPEMPTQTYQQATSHPVEANRLTTSQPSSAIAPPSQLVIEPRTDQKVHVFWNVSDAERQALRAQGGRKMMLRLYDVTDQAFTSSASPIDVFECQLFESKLDVPIPIANHQYVAELGYITNDERWLPLVHSEPSQVPPLFSNASDEAISAMAQLPVESQMQSVKAEPDECRVNLRVQSSTTVYVNWQVPKTESIAAKEQGGQQFALRLYDVTYIDMDYQRPHSMQQFICVEEEQEQVFSVPVSDRDYIVEVGYTTNDNRWLRLARSLHAHVPAV